MNKEKLISEISKDLMLPQHITEAVIDRFIDVAIEEIVNNGEFSLHRLFSISSFDVKSYVTPKGTSPSRKRLSIKLSYGVNELFKKTIDSGKKIVTRDNWKELLVASKTKKNPVRKPLNKFSNPMLEDDE